MGYEWENYCVGCERCANCGRREDVKVYYCDACGDSDDDMILYKGEDGQELCWDCFIKQYESRVCDDTDDTICANCGSDDEILYLVDGEWVCEDCLKGMAERVDTE